MVTNRVVKECFIVDLNHLEHRTTLVDIFHDLTDDHHDKHGSSLTVHIVYIVDLVNQDCEVSCSKRVDNFQTLLILRDFFNDGKHHKVKD